MALPSFCLDQEQTERQKKYSDIDIGLESKDGKSLENFDLWDLEEKIQTQANIPYMVDLVDFSQVSDDFAKVAKKSIKMLS